MAGSRSRAAAPSSSAAKRCRLPISTAAAARRRKERGRDLSVRRQPLGLSRAYLRAWRRRGLPCRARARARLEALLAGVLLHGPARGSRALLPLRLVRRHADLALLLPRHLRDPGRCRLARLSRHAHHADGDAISLAL